MISNSVITMFLKEVLRTVIKGPVTHAWKGIDKFVLAPQKKPGFDAGAGATAGRRMEKVPGIGSFLGLSNELVTHIESYSVNQLTDSPPSRWPE